LSSVELRFGSGGYMWPPGGLLAGGGGGGNVG
jgi:hypothetical protein